MGCDGPGKVYRFAQIVAAATLSLEISASAAMATAGSENFFRPISSAAACGEAACPRIPPHHDPACWGCGDNPRGLRLPLPTEEGSERYEAVSPSASTTRLGPGSSTADSSRRARRGLAGCSPPGTASPR